MVCHSVSAQSLARTTSPRGQGTVALLAASHGLRSCLSRVGSYHLGSLESVYCCFGEGGESIHRFLGDLVQPLGGSTDSEWRYFKDLLRVELSDLVSGRPMRKGRWQGTKPAIDSWERCLAGLLCQNHSGLPCSIPMRRNLATLPLIGAGTGWS